MYVSKGRKTKLYSMQFLLLLLKYLFIFVVLSFTAENSLMMYFYELLILSFKAEFSTCFSSKVNIFFIELISIQVYIIIHKCKKKNISLLNLRKRTRKLINIKTYHNALYIINRL